MAQVQREPPAAEINRCIIASQHRQRDYKKALPDSGKASNWAQGLDLNQRMRSFTHIPIVDNQRITKVKFDGDVLSSDELCTNYAPE